MDTSTIVMVALTLLEQVILVHLVLHAQRMRLMMDMMMMTMMSALRCQI